MVACTILFEDGYSCEFTDRNNTKCAEALDYSKEILECKSEYKISGCEITVQDCIPSIAYKAPYRCKDSGDAYLKNAFPK